jgi:hypothetical protein
MTISTARRLGVLLLALTTALTLSAGAVPAGRPAPAPRSKVCDSTGPISAAQLTSGVSGCTLVGRVVVHGDAAVVVPPPGYGVGADGVAGAGANSTDSLQVSNFGGVVRASLEADLMSAGRAPVRLLPRAVGACSATQSRFESGRHPWATRLKWRYHQRSQPRRFTGTTALRHVKAAMNNMRLAQNDCHMTSRLRARATYVGVSSVGSGIKVKGGAVTCGALNSKNVVGWGALPAGLLGWTCFWWGARNKMIAADIRLSTDPRVVTTFPEECVESYDLQSLATHEWGHAWGLDHVANAHLTMHHLLPACSTEFRSLGRGDVRGMRRLYG